MVSSHPAQAAAKPRPLGVTNGADSAAYGYLANSPLVSQITFRSSSTTRMTTSRQFDYLNRLLAVSNTARISVSWRLVYAGGHDNHDDCSDRGR